MMNEEELKEAAKGLINERKIPSGISVIEHATITQLAGVYTDKRLTTDERHKSVGAILDRYERRMKHEPSNMRRK